MIRAHVLILSSCLLLACNRSPSTKDKPTPNAAREAGLEFPRDASAFTAELERIDVEIGRVEARAAAHPTGWLSLEKLAGLWLQRARLSGDYDDYAKAEDALARAFERGKGFGPLLTRASLNFTLHRLDAVGPDLDRAAAGVIIDNPTRARIEAMRGDLAFARGQYAAARTHFDAALALTRQYPLVCKLALWHWRVGEFDEAEALFNEAEGMLVGEALEPRAWLDLQRGLMDLERGRYEQAFAHYREGAAMLGGWWLLEEHIAEIAALLGQPKFAMTLYDEIIARTGKGEFMDAKASLLAEAGDAEGSAALVEQATAAYEADLAQFPEAAFGHALDHFLEFGPPARALELAEANHKLRPNVEAKLGLARARLGVDDVAGAKAIIDEALATPWVSAELFWIAAEVYAKHGDATKAEDLRKQAKAINPRIEG